MAEDYDYDPGAWKGHDFKSARAAYDSHAGRSYAEAQTAGKTAADCVPDRISTQSFCPLVIMTDVTGSMGEWPAVMFSKLPYLDIEGKQYLGSDMEISFAANTDLYDSFPLQISAFATGPTLVDKLKFVIGGGGGPDQGHEAYEIGALYYIHNVDMPNAVRPIFIFIADEEPHTTVTPAIAKKNAKAVLTKTWSIDEVFAALKEKYSVYLVHKWYSEQSRNEWVRLLGEDRIADLDDPNRVVDVIFGILAKETNRIDYFKKEIEGRQNASQVATTYTALQTIHRGASETGVAKVGNSTMHRASTGKASKDLI